MKRKLLWALAVLIAGAAMWSCQSEETNFEESDLVGKWQQTDSGKQTTYYRYNADHTGSTWDTSEVEGEHEAQKLTWQLVRTELEQIHIMEMEGDVHKRYNVLELTATRLRYEDQKTGRVDTFRKVH